ncbi:MAG: type I-E CRISPR-associated endonuclease Cas1e [Acidimicrobiales bacterium]|jgi:CRISPR-associated protein Cas1
MNMRLDADKVSVHALLPVSRRMSFIYLERCVVHRDANAITATDQDGVVHLPAASISALLLGPGTRITHQAMVLLSDSGVVTCWVGEGGARLYGWAPSLSTSTRLLEVQARLVSSRTKRLSVARLMYEQRFPNEDVGNATMQQLRGMEGARVRRVYREEADRVGIEWTGRRYDPKDWSAGDIANKALSVANSCLYGTVHAVIVALGCSPGLGFVHTGHPLSFVYDVADLYKTVTSIPAAFEISAEGSEDLARRVRGRVREHIYEEKILDRAVSDIQRLLLGCIEDVPMSDEDHVSLWDEHGGDVEGGVGYGDAE